MRLRCKTIFTSTWWMVISEYFGGRFGLVCVFVEARPQSNEGGYSFSWRFVSSSPALLSLYLSHPLTHLSHDFSLPDHDRFQLCDLGEDDPITSVSWTQRGSHVSVGTTNGEVQIWDAAKCKQVRSMGGHQARVGTMAWNSTLLASGSRDRSIYIRDIAD